MSRPRPELVAFALGVLSLALILGALGFQYIGGYPPCEICHWQRWPHIAAAAIGILGGRAVSAKTVDAKLGWPIAILTILLVAISGAIGVYHAGIEWKWWPGPSACTGSAFQLTGKLDLNAHVVMCDHAAWRMIGISMAGYNAMISLGAAVLALVALTTRDEGPA
ncbi:MAG TPA: disulfide bond formation protein B [Rhizomicrobium sp.]|jgi:disulfide bond formation protein DsbB|nr:disulfide bond formation protein B [Rhizomicrobium sp.]